MNIVMAPTPTLNIYLVSLPLRQRIELMKSMVWSKYHRFVLFWLQLTAGTAVTVIVKMEGATEDIGYVEISANATVSELHGLIVEELDDFPTSAAFKILKNG